jgi:hypothetical protein
MIRAELKKYVFEPQFKKIVQYVQEQITESVKRLGTGSEIKVNHGYFVSNLRQSFLSVGSEQIGTSLSTSKGHWERMLKYCNLQQRNLLEQQI